MNEDLKKSLSHLIENANTMLLNLDHIHALAHADKKQSLAAHEKFSALFEIITLQKNYKKESVKIVDDVLANMEASFVDMELTYNQEQALLSTLNMGIDKSIKHYENGTQLDEHMESTLKEIAVTLNA
jgi:hypothetical protein